MKKNNVLGKYQSLFSKLDPNLSIIPIKLKGFIKFCNQVYTLSYSNKDSETQFEEFFNSIYLNLGRKYFPVIRVSDGEFALLLGSQKPGNWWPLIYRVKKYIRFTYHLIYQQNTFSNTFYSGDSTISKDKIYSLRKKSTENLVKIANEGIIAAHLSFSLHPFQQDFIESFLKIFKKKQNLLNKNNLFPFYFVYALLASPKINLIVKDRNICVISSADKNKREIIREKIMNLGAKNIDFLTIPNEKTYEYILENAPKKNFDIIFLGAGISKFMIMPQLAKYNVPVVDIGFFIEIWANPIFANARPFCLYDPNFK